MPSFYDNIARMMMGVGGSQAVIILASPLIARIFSPDDFGIAAFFLSLVTLMVIPATFRLEHAIVLPKDNQEAVDLIIAASKVLLGSVVAIFLVLILLEILFPGVRIKSNLEYGYYLIPLGVLVTGFGQIVTGWGTREKVFGAIGKGNLFQSVFIVMTRLGIGVYSGSSALLLMITQVLGVVVRIVTIGGTLPVFRTISSFNKKPNKLKDILQAYKQFPLFSVPTGLLRAFNDNLPILIFATLYEPLVAGLYTMASRLIKVPVQIIGEPVRLAYLQRLSELANHGKRINKSLFELTCLLAFTSVLIIAPLVLYGKEIFSFVLGDNWVEAGTYAAIISPWFTSVFIQVPSACLYVVFKKQKQLMFFHGLALVLMLSVAGIAFFFKINITDVLIYFSAIGTILNICIVIKAFVIGSEPILNKIKLESAK